MKNKKNIEAIRARMIYLTVAITLVMIVVSIVVFYGVRNVLCSSKAPGEINLYKSHGFRNLESVDVSISVKGTELSIPADIGRGDKLLRPLHTDDESGRIIIESECGRDFTLGDFFRIWGKNFNRSCVMDYCDDANNTIKMLVDGDQNNDYDNLILRNGQKISIIYS